MHNETKREDSVGSYEDAAISASPKKAKAFGRIGGSIRGSSPKQSIVGMLSERLSTCSVTKSSRMSSNVQDSIRSRNMRPKTQLMNMDIHKE